MKRREDPGRREAETGNIQEALGMDEGMTCHLAGRGLPRGDKVKMGYGGEMGLEIEEEMGHGR
jgi:hypothetical protein